MKMKRINLINVLFVSVILTSIFFINCSSEPSSDNEDGGEENEPNANLETLDQDPEKKAGITGAITGVFSTGKGITVFIFVVIIIALAIFIAVMRKRKTEKRNKNP